MWIKIISILLINVILDFEAHECYILFYNFPMDFIEISWYWKFTMKINFIILFFQSNEQSQINKLLILLKAHENNARRVIDWNEN
jgi:hypothetical protein